MCRAVDSLVSSYSWRKALCCSWNQNPAWSKVAAKPFKGKRGRSLSDFTRWLRLIRQVLHRQVSPSCAALIFPLFNLIIRFVCFTSVCWFLFYYFLGGGRYCNHLLNQRAPAGTKTFTVFMWLPFIKTGARSVFFKRISSVVAKKMQRCCGGHLLFLGGGAFTLQNVI